MLPEPDYTQTVWPTIEEKLGRKMTEDENRRFMYRGGGMFKEWFYDQLKRCATPEQAENLLARSLAPWEVYTPPSLLSRILKFLGL